MSFKTLDDQYTVPLLLTDHLGTQGQSSDDRGYRMVGGFEFRRKISTYKSM